MKNQYVLILDNEDMKLAVDFYLGYPNIHFELKIPATHNMIKYLKTVVFEELLTMLGVHGHEMIIAVIPKHDKKLLRFCKLFGFEVEAEFNGRIMLAQDIM